MVDSMGAEEVLGWILVSFDGGNCAKVDSKKLGKPVIANYNYFVFVATQDHGWA